MKDPIHDLHFVPFETALRLRDAGYKEESLFVYRYNTETKDDPELISLGSPKKNIELKKYSTVAALTYEEAREWLLQTFHFGIAIFPYDYNYSLNVDSTDEFEMYVAENGPILGWIEKVYQIIFTADRVIIHVIHDKEKELEKIEYDSTYQSDLSLNKGVAVDYYKAYNDCINLILDNLL